MSVTCIWQQDVEGDWDTSCGHRFSFIEGMPNENDINFCCYCGKPLDGKPYDDLPVSDDA